MFILILVLGSFSLFSENLSSRTVIVLALSAGLSRYFSLHPIFPDDGLQVLNAMEGLFCDFQSWCYSLSNYYCHFCSVGCVLLSSSLCLFIK